MATTELEKVIQQAKKLSTGEQLELLQSVASWLRADYLTQQKPLQENSDVGINEDLLLSSEEVARMVDPTPSRLKGEALAKFRNENGAFGMLEIDPEIDSVDWLKAQRSKRDAENSW